MAEDPTTETAPASVVRHPDDIPVTRVGPAELDEFARELRRAVRIAIDT